MISDKKPRRRQRAIQWCKSLFDSEKQSEKQNAQNILPGNGSSQSQESSMAQPVQSSTTQDRTVDPEVDSLPPKSLWEAAYHLLDDSQQAALARVQVTVESSSDLSTPNPMEIMDKVIEKTKVQYKEYRNGSLRIPMPNGHEINVREVSENIITAALDFKDTAAAIAAFDPTRYASSAWAVVSIGLDVSVSWISDE